MDLPGTVGRGPSDMKRPVGEEEDGPLRRRRREPVDGVDIGKEVACKPQASQPRTNDGHC